MAVTPSADNKTSTLTYTLIYDQAALADDAERESMRTKIQANFGRDIKTMKMLAEK